MSDRQIIPNADSILSTVLTELYAKRPNAFAHCNLRRGVYFHPCLGFRSQAALMLRRLSKLAAARRLKTATGTELLDYVASEFNAVPDTEKTFAEGSVILSRLDPTLTDQLGGGSYPKGTKFVRTATTIAGVDLATAEYETLIDVHIPQGSTDWVEIPVRAVQAGVSANAPILVGQDMTSSITLPGLVENMLIRDFQAGGGSEGPDDDFVRLYARAYAVGQYGPTSGASRLGALGAGGVRHPLVFDHPQDGSQTILIADSSWGSSRRWASIAQQKIYDADLVGFGCKVKLGQIRSRTIAIVATVSLRDTSFLQDTTDITTAIQAAVRAYFDDRIDWNVWNRDSLRSAISRAHPKIFSCSFAVVKDATTGAAVSEILTPDYDTEQVHLMLANNAMTISFESPS